MSAQRVIFLNRFYWPDESATAQLLRDLSTALAARQFDVTVISSRPAGPTVPVLEASEGVTIYRVRSTHWGKRRLTGRAVDFLSYYCGALWRLFLLARRGDTVVVMTDPPLLGLLVGPVAALRGTEVINWVQDIYPEVAIALTNNKWLRVFVPLRNHAWRSSSACVVPGEDMKNTLLQHLLAQERVIVSPNWGPAGVTISAEDKVSALREEWGVAGKFVVMYSGNLGRVHDVDPLVEVAESLRNENNIVLLFVGGGARRQSLEKAIRARKLANVLFRDPQPRKYLSESLAVGDLHLVTLLEGAERWVFPSKLYGITKAGRPVLFVGNPESEIARLVTKQNVGEAFIRKSPAAIATAIIALRGNPSRLATLRAAAREFSRNNLEEAIETWTQLLRGKLAATQPGGPYLRVK